MKTALIETGRAAKAIGGIYAQGIRILLGPKLQEWFDLPNVTAQARIATMGDIELKSRAEQCMRTHNFFDVSQLPKGETASVDNCPVANLIGGEIDARSLLSFDFLDTWERLLMLEFIERFDMGRYPQLEKKETES